ncbi:MAG: hypothetical protein HOV81_15200 [Kofleriaceae bacterium]|nr:hypothetical protein [Kofleriaceae bacterium]
MTCPRPDELARLLDGELSENRAAAARAHLESCAHCTRELAVQRRLLDDLAAPAAGIEADRLVASVVARLTPQAARRSRAPMFAGLVAATAAALVLVLVAVRPDRDAGTFAARGGSGGLAREVGVVLHRLAPQAIELTRGEHVRSDTRYLATYRNIGSTVHLLAFAVDAQGTVHWLYPAYLDARTDPGALALAPVAHETALPDAVVLDRPAPGPLRLITIVSASPRSVSMIERLSPAELQPAALASRFPDDVIRELVVNVDESRVSPP